MFSFDEVDEYHYNYIYNEQSLNNTHIPEKCTKLKPRRMFFMKNEYMFKHWKQPLVEIQGKTAYNRLLWSGPSHNENFSTPSLPSLLYFVFK